MYVLGFSFINYGYCLINGFWNAFVNHDFEGQQKLLKYCHIINTCPQFLNLAPTAPKTAFVKSALLNTMNGALPPNSKATLLTLVEHCLYNSLPTAVEPRGKIVILR